MYSQGSICDGRLYYIDLASKKEKRNKAVQRVQAIEQTD